MRVRRFSISIFISLFSFAQQQQIAPVADSEGSLVKWMTLQEAMEKLGIESVFSRIPADKFGMPDELITNRVNVKQHVQLKKQSMDSHKTQLNPNGPVAKMPQEMWDEWRSVETFAFAAGEALRALQHPERRSGDRRGRHRTRCDARRLSVRRADGRRHYLA